MSFLKIPTYENFMPLRTLIGKNTHIRSGTVFLRKMAIGDFLKSNYNVVI